MPDTIKPGTILIKECSLLPNTLRFESELCVPGWRLVKDLDGCTLDRKIREAGWTSFCPVGQVGTTVFGIEEQKILSRVIEQILANLESAEFNCLEIMRVASGASKRFLGVHYMTVSAQSRHIQESAPQFWAKDLSLRNSAHSLPLETMHRPSKPSTLPEVISEVDRAFTEIGPTDGKRESLQPVARAHAAKQVI